MDPLAPPVRRSSLRRRARRWRRSRVAATLAVGALAVVGTTVAGATLASAAVRCSVDFTTPARWNTGFTGNALIRNTGDRVDGWTLTWRFVAGERLAQGWMGDFTSSGADVTVRQPSWARTIESGGSATIGWNGTHTGSVTTPTDVRLNGVACTVNGVAPGAGATTGTTSAPTPSPTRTATATPSATVSPTPSASPTATPTSTPSPTATPTTTPTSSPSPSPTSTTAAWSPPASMAGALAEVWAHQEATYADGDLYSFRNYGWDQVVANGGYLNICVRWDSDQPVSAQLRDQIHAKYAEQYAKWFDTLRVGGQGWNGWPYPEVKINVVGWAVRDRSQLQWTDSSVDIYVGDIREDAPQCAESRGRYFHQDGVYPGGAARHYDQSLWLTQGMGGGAGGDWGQRMGSEYFVGALGSADVTILQHEIGHTFGLDDFYDWTPTGQNSFVMLAGSSPRVTEFDSWMFRDWWRHLKSRYAL